MYFCWVHLHDYSVAVKALVVVNINLALAATEKRAGKERAVVASSEGAGNNVSVERAKAKPQKRSDGAKREEFVNASCRSEAPS